MQTLVQVCGRGMRAPDDRCENFLIDDNARWFIWKYRRFAPTWFLNSVRWRKTVPAPPPALVA
jgi:Rad3-related DNA helicase